MFCSLAKPVSHPLMILTGRNRRQTVQQRCILLNMTKVKLRNCHYVQLQNSKTSWKSQWSLDCGHIHIIVSHQRRFRSWLGTNSLLLLKCAWLAQLSSLMLFRPGTTKCLSSAEWVLLLKVCCGNKHNEKRARGIMVFLTVFKANESSSFSCYLTFPHNSFQLRWLFIFPSVAGPGFDPGKAELHLKLCFFDVYPLFKSKFMLDTLQCKDEGLFICMFFMLGLCFSYLAWFHLRSPPSPSL